MFAIVSKYVGMCVVCESRNFAEIITECKFLNDNFPDEYEVRWME